MIRRVQSIFSIFVVASAAMLGGCAVGTETDDTSDDAIDALVGGDADDTSTPDETAGEPTDGRLGAPTFAVRDAPARDTGGLGAGEPRPVPWKQAETSATGGAASSADDDGESPPSPPVGDAPDYKR